MLNTLTIRDFAIIDHCELSLTTGLNVFSGETGAGKSILIDAIAQLMGARAEATMIRHQQEKADIQAQFSLISPVAQAYLEVQELTDEEQTDACFLRKVLKEKGSKVFINHLASAGNHLKELGTQLIHIHGQNHQQTLLKSSAQRERLDRFAQVKDELSKTAKAWADLKAAEDALQQWQIEEHKRQERSTLLQFQIEALRKIAPQEGEFADLSEQQQILSHADQILSTGGHILDTLQEREPSVQGILRQLLRESDSLSSKHEDFQESHQLLEQAQVYLDEAYDALSRRLQRIEHNPERLQSIESRMSALHNLARQLHIAVEDLPRFWQEREEEIAALEGADDKKIELEQAIENARNHYLACANCLHDKRLQAAQAFSEIIEHWIRRLGMPHAIFQVAINETTPSAHGIDEVQFLICANPGQALAPIHKIASGGELSRIGLAIEVACAKEEKHITLIFDEADAGIGGEIADSVGALLRTLAEERQILCITHLPQVACWAHSHFYIHKASDGKSTQTQVKRLNEEERIVEIARMLGDATSPTSLEHAKTLLKAHVI